MKKTSAKKVSKPAKTTDEELADLLLKRNTEREQRMDRAGKAIQNILDQEQLSLAVSGFKLVDGRLIPEIQLKDARPAPR